jgi:GNAT superfamily N-acetyltransferase
MSTTEPDLVWATLAERPDLAAHLHGFPDEGVAEFLYHDPVSVALFERLIARHPEFTLIAVDRTGGAPVAMICTVPFTPEGASLPPGGYDAVLLSAADDVLARRRGSAVSALFATVHASRRGQGISARLLDAALRNTAGLGYPALVAPVRPTRKHEQPGVPMAEYITRTRADGLPADPWLRVHIRAGGYVVGVAPRSMTITGTLDEWRGWTGLPFTTSGAVEVPGGLVPVTCDAVHNVATYVEPNVWVRHDLHRR